MAAIAVQAVTIRRRGRSILEDVDLTVDGGERVALLGPSGSGKTSLLRVIAGLDRPGSGFVEVSGRPAERRAPGTTMVFQGDAVYEHLDVGENLAFPLQGGRDGIDVEERVGETASRFYLRGLLDRSPDRLSAGQRRVVAAARALARDEVSVVLLDDPLVGADRHLRRRLVDAVMADPTVTVLFATREAEDTFRWADRVAVLAGGGVAQTGAPPDVYHRPVSVQVAETLGEMNRIPATYRRSARIVEVAGSRLEVEGAGPDVDDGHRVVIGIRPPELQPASPSTPFSRRLRGTVGRVEPIGARQRVLFGLGDRRGMAFSAEVDRSVRVPPGSTVDWLVPPAAMRLYEPVTGIGL